MRVVVSNSDIIAMTTVSVVLNAIPLSNYSCSNNITSCSSAVANIDCTVRIESTLQPTIVFRFLSSPPSFQLGRRGVNGVRKNCSDLASKSPCTLFINFNFMVSRDRNNNYSSTEVTTSTKSKRYEKFII